MWTSLTYLLNSVVDLKLSVAGAECGENANFIRRGSFLGHSLPQQLAQSLQSQAPLKLWQREQGLCFLP